MIRIFYLTVICFLTTTNVFAQYTELHSFSSSSIYGTDNSIIEYNGLLYGTTSWGGTNNGGVIYSCSKDGSSFQTIFNFPSMYLFPCGSLLAVNGVFYGMTTQGGGHGQIYKINVDGTNFQYIHNFIGGDYNNGARPYGSLVLLGSKLFGMTKTGGEDINVGNGTIFSIDTSGLNFNIIHRFDYTECNPYGSLTIVNNELFGMTCGNTASLGSHGTIFKINPDGTGYSTLHFFNGVDGSKPNGNLIADGNILYGMTPFGGGGTYPPGNIFKINTDGSGFQVLFSGLNGNQYGSRSYGSLKLVGDVLYGKTSRNIYSIKTDGSNYQWYNWNLYGSFNFSGNFEYNDNLIFDGNYLYGVNGFGRIIYKLVPYNLTQISEQSKTDLVLFYPNPNKGEFYLSNNLNTNKQHNLQIRNSIGELVFEKNNCLGNSKINVESLLGIGLYFLDIFDSNGIKISNTSKLLITQ